MQRITLFLFMLCMALGVSAQRNFTLQGELRDSLSGEPVTYATVRATLSGAKNPTAVAATDDKGRFTLNIAKAGNYRVDVSYIGMKPISRTVRLTADSRKKDLGILRMLNTNTLTEVKVQAQRNIVKADIDKVTYSMEDDPDSDSNPLLEMLRKVPMVTVDGEDNIQVNGSSSFKIYVNGKPNNMMSSNPSDILKNYPASSVKSVEVITDPGARFDAEGVAGILNIITHSGVKTSGYSFSPRVNVENRGIRGGAFLLAQVGKFTLSANYGFGTNPWEPKSKTESRREMLQGSHTLFTSKGEGEHNGFFNFGSFEASYEATKRDMFTLNAGLHGHKGTNGNNSHYNMQELPIVPEDPVVELYSYDRISKGSSKRMSFDVGFDYQHTFGKIDDGKASEKEDKLAGAAQGKPGQGKGGPGGGRGHGGPGGPHGGGGGSSDGPARGSIDAPTLTLSYRFNHAPSYERSDNFYTGVTPAPGYVLSLLDLRSHPDRKSQEHSAQLDFSTPFLEHHTISVGGKYTRRNNYSDDKEYSRPYGSSDNWTLSQPHSLEYQHLNDIAAAYAEYTYKLKSFTVRGGLRYEYSHINVDYPNNTNPLRTGFSANFSDFVPSVSLGYNIKLGQMIKVVYNMRLGRPNITQLSPYRDQSQPQTISYGYEKLETENAHNLNLNYTYFNTKFNLSTTLGYNFSNNGITPFTFVQSDGAGNNLVHSTFDNILRTRTANLNIFANWTIVPGTQVNLNMNADYRTLEARYDKSHQDVVYGLSRNDSNDGFGMFLFAGLRQDLPWKLKLGVNGGFGLPRIELQGKGSSFYFYGVRLSRSFLEGDRLTVTLRANNFIHPKFRHENTVNTPQYHSFSSYEFNRLRFGFSVSYRFGKLKVEDVQRLQRSMQSEDMQGGAGQSYGGGTD